MTVSLAYNGEGLGTMWVKRRLFKCFSKQGSKGLKEI